VIAQAIFLSVISQGKLLTKQYNDSVIKICENEEGDPVMSNVKRLYRSRYQKKLAGVCAGLADFFQIDVTVIRLLWVFLVVFAGAGILAYIIAWIIIPEEP
jgi:phage shock protein C